MAEDPGLGLRFAFFTMLARLEAMPGTEQVPGRLQQVLRRAVILPLVVISLLVLLAASGLTPSRSTCAAGTKAAPAMPVASHAARCQAGRAVNLEQVGMH